MKIFISCLDLVDDRGPLVSVAEAVMLSRLQADVSGNQASIMEGLIAALLTHAEGVTIEVLS